MNKNLIKILISLSFLFIACRQLQPSPINMAPPREQSGQPTPGGSASPVEECTHLASLLSQSQATDSTIQANTIFLKTWVIKNEGTCTWGTDTQLVWIRGVKMAEEPNVNLTGAVAPGESVQISLELLSPAVSGSYQAGWMLHQQDGGTWGLGPTMEVPFEVNISVDASAMAVPPAQAFDPALAIQAPGMGGGISTDVDEDGLEDNFETWLADTFFPVLVFDEDEQTTPDKVMRLYQVTPIYKQSPGIWNYPQYTFGEYQGPEGILITYVMAYTDDFGYPWNPTVITGLFIDDTHAGDTETLRIFLVNPPDDPFTWVPAALLIKRHHGPEERYYPVDFAWTQTHPIAYVSQGKHAMYTSEGECDDFLAGEIVHEHCNGGFVINYPILPGVDGFNVGEREPHPFALIPANTLGLFTNEFAWASLGAYLPQFDNSGLYDGTFDRAAVFCGGYASYGLCGGGLDAKWWPLADSAKQADVAARLASYANPFFVHNFGAAFQVCFFTGDVDHAGTDLHVDVTLQGTAHALTLTDVDSAFDDFERGDTSCFEVGTYTLEEKWTSLILSVYNDPEDDSEWFLEKIYVYEYANGERWVFECNCWVDKTSGFDPDTNQNKDGPEIYLSPVGQ